MIAVNTDRKSRYKGSKQGIPKGSMSQEVSPMVTSRRAPWHPGFLKILGKISRLARYAFRHYSPELREEYVQEVVVNCMVAYRRLFYRRQIHRAFPSSLARFAISQVKCGRQVGTKLNVRDVSSRYAHVMKGFHLARLDHYDEEEEEWREILISDNRYPVPECVAFRLDYPAWVSRFKRRDQRVIAALGRSECTQDVAKMFDVSPGRVSQMRREYYEDWQLFQRGA